MKKGRSKSISMVTTQGSGVRRESILIIQLPLRRSMLRSTILMPRVMARLCLPLPMPLRMRALRENAIIATSLDIRRKITGS